MYGGNSQPLDLSVSNENYLTEPGVYEGVLESVEAVDTKSGKPALVFKFSGSQVDIVGDGQTSPVPNSVKGSASMYELEHDTLERIQNQKNRIGVIMARFVGEQAASNMVGVVDWDSYRRWVINTLANRYKNVPVVFKLVPNTYNQDKPSVNFPNYKGAVALKSEVKTSFGLSSKELSDAQQLKALRAKINSASTGSSTSVSAQSSGDSPIY